MALVVVLVVLVAVLVVLVVFLVVLVVVLVVLVVVSGVIQEFLRKSPNASLEAFDDSLRNPYSNGSLRNPYSNGTRPPHHTADGRNNSPPPGPDQVLPRS